MLQSADPFERVLAALAADPATDFGTPGSTVERLARIEGLYSSVLRVRIRTPARTLQAYVKVLKPRGPGDEERAQADRFLMREYQATAAFYQAVQRTPGIGAVRPIAILPEHRAMVTEEVPGRPLGEILARAREVTDGLTAIASRVGSWTRTYQAVGGESGEVEVAQLRAYLDHRLRLIEGRVLAPGGRAEALARFDALAAELERPALRAVPIHADLGPMNIIVDDEGRVTVLDFTMAKSGTRFHDLSHVYFHLGLMAARDPRRKGLFGTLQRAMLAGYDPALVPEHPLFRLMLLQHGVCHVALLAERRLPVVDPAYRWFLRRRWSVCQQLVPAQPELRAV